jgi:pimeloyl-ACP methyl ester carboxylesterase
MAVQATTVRDLVIVVPGIMGSELVDAKGRRVWSVSPGALANAVRTLGKSLRRLQLPPGIGDEAPSDGVRATALLSSLHVVPGLWSPIIGYDGLLDFLRSSRFRLIETKNGDNGVIPNLISFPYDWRLSNRFNGRLLAKVANEALDRWRTQVGMAEAKLVLVCHSMGGLIARWFAEQEGGAGLIRAMITIGTPHRGSLKALANLVNGVEPGIGPLRLSLTEFVRSLPSLHQMLPQYDCLVTDTGRQALTEDNCKGLDETMFADAVKFHKAIRGSDPAPYSLHKIVGIRQPTPTTARFTDGKIMPLEDIDGQNQGGDGTVALLAAEPVIGRGTAVHTIADQHGELQGARSFLDLVDGILSREEIIWQAAPPDGFGVEMPDVLSTRDDPAIRITEANNRRLLVTLKHENGQTVMGPVPVPPDSIVHFGRLPEAGYRAVVASASPGGPSPVSKPFLVLDPDTESESAYD